MIVEEIITLAGMLELILCMLKIRPLKVYILSGSLRMKAW